MAPLGPTFRYSESVGANATVRPLQDQAWIYRVLPFPAVVYLTVDATGVGLALTFSAGSDIQAGPDQPIQAGGTAGVFVMDQTFADQYLGAGGDELQLVIRNTTGGALTYNLLIRLQPI